MKWKLLYYIGVILEDIGVYNSSVNYKMLITEMYQDSKHSLENHARPLMA